MTKISRPDGITLVGEIVISGEICTSHSPCCQKCDQVPICVLGTRNCRDHVISAPCGRVIGFLAGKGDVDGGFWVAECDAFAESYKKSQKSGKVELPADLGYVIYRNTEEYHIREDTDRE